VHLSDSDVVFASIGLANLPDSDVIQDIGKFGCSVSPGFGYDIYIYIYIYIYRVIEIGWVPCN